ncbi:hypothetical protein [Olivibacter ginsenosidimutans]
MMQTKIDELISLVKQMLQAIINLPDILRQLQNQPAPLAATPRILDNADVKQMLKIGDTKLYYLKKKKILKPYKLDGKDVYLENEVLDAIRRTGEL